MDEFPHLRFVQKLTGKALFSPIPIKPPERTKHNLQNRNYHSEALTGQVNETLSRWDKVYEERNQENLAPLDREVIPVFLEINSKKLADKSFNLETFGIEIISEVADGYIIGASLDKLKSLSEKVANFSENAPRTGKVAEIWSIVTGDRSAWKPSNILSKSLFAKWSQINDDEIYSVEVAIAFTQSQPKEPNQNGVLGQKRYQRYLDKMIQWDEAVQARENHFDQFLEFYHAERTSSFISLNDSFGCSVDICGKGLKDLVLNYPYVFEVIEHQEIDIVDGSDDHLNIDAEAVFPPNGQSPEIGVIDSGIMEQHSLLSPAISKDNSISYLAKSDSTADYVKNGGHGTKVAGRILYPNGVSNINFPYTLPFFIRNLRILNEQNEMEFRYPPELMEQIVNENSECSIFNLSINSKNICETKHMSAWSAALDTLIHENNVLFVVSSGNLRFEAIQYFLKDTQPYPKYFNDPACLLADPASSSFSLVVGSVNHASFESESHVSLGGKHEISAFSRIGLGLWGHIKPDVVDYGGGLVISKTGHDNISNEKVMSPELINSTLYNNHAYSRDSVGTSFATPRVTHIVAQLRRIYPDADINLLRCLVVQGARLPNEHFHHPTLDAFKKYGYGIPSFDRVTRNTQSRITFYASDRIRSEQAKIYSLRIPKEITNQANEYEVLVEVTMAYSCKVRRTRQRTKSYLGTWLEWISSKGDESKKVFHQRVMVTNNGSEEGDFGNPIQWKIRERKNWGVNGLHRNNSSLQKDWVILKAHEVPNELSFAVRAHEGWDKDREEVPFSLAVSIEVLDAVVPIYDLIRVENEVEIEIEG